MNYDALTAFTLPKDGNVSACRDPVPALRRLLGEPEGYFRILAGEASACLRAIHGMRTRGGRAVASLRDTVVALAHSRSDDFPIRVTSDLKLFDTDLQTVLNREGPVVIVISMVNREYGILFDISDTLRQVKAIRPDASVLIDATAAPGWIQFAGFPEEVDFVAFGTAALGCPEGMSVLWARVEEDMEAPALWTGLGPEVGSFMLEALSAAAEQWADRGSELADAAHRATVAVYEVLRGVDGIALNFSGQALHPSTMNYCVQDIHSDVLQAACASLGLRIGTGAPEFIGTTMCSPLTTFLFKGEERYSNVRFSASPVNTEIEAHIAAETFTKALALAREL